LKASCDAILDVEPLHICYLFKDRLNSLFCASVEKQQKPQNSEACHLDHRSTNSRLLLY
jgi:hypothetical protein